MSQSSLPALGVDRLVEYVADPGTCWVGDLTLLGCLMKEVKQAGGTAIKPQFWPARIYKGHPLEETAVLCTLDEVVIEHIVKMARKVDLELWFSVFGLNEFRVLEGAFPEVCKTVKIAESQSRNYKLIEAVLSSEVVERMIVSLASREADAKLWERVCEMDLERSDYQSLFCVPKYPAAHEDVRFPRPHKGEGDFGAAQTWYGFSDHTLGSIAAETAVAKGAQMIEKHVRPIPITYTSLLGRIPHYPDEVCDINSHLFYSMIEGCGTVRRMVDWS